MRFALALLLLALPTAAAQLPEPAFALEAALGLPAEARPDSATEVALHVNATADGLVCPEAAEIPLALAVEAARTAEGVLLELPPNATLVLPAGAHAEAAEPATAHAVVAGRLLVARFAEGGREAAWTVRVVLDAAGAGCLPDGGRAEAAAEARTRVARLPESDPLHHPSHEAHGGDAFDAYLAPGERFAHTFRAPGVYGYHDHLDPARKGVVQVMRSVNETSAEVRITAAGYEPPRVTVAVNATVTWVNGDGVTRTVSLDEAHGAVDLEPAPQPREVAAAGTEEAPGLAWALVGVALVAAAGLRRRA